ncbi:SDR family oxidoreductase [Dactylosporangium sp. NPDC051485]|uniref:SDR family oxidoreductase n=1 Tax=Dactylosporangium sp. NPDC051485 TaxID=3154846 RepID=UPI003424A072
MAVSERQVCVIIGMGGMGRAIARRIGHGRTLLIADRDEESIEALAVGMREEGLLVEATVADVTSARSMEQLSQLAHSLGPVAHVVHTAGLSPAQGSLADILAVNVLGPAHMLETFAGVMMPGGSAVVIASNAGHMDDRCLSPDDRTALTGTPAAELMHLPLLSEERFESSSAAYRFAKRVVQLRVQAAAVPWSTGGCRVNSVSPGVTATPMGRSERAAGNQNVERLISESPVGRVAAAEEIAEAVAFLLSSSASFIYGSDLLVDGGAVAARLHPLGR